MKRQLWLHAGLHKTGSTYIQTLIARHVELLANEGIYFRPPEGPIEGNYREAWALQQGDLEPVLDYARAGFDTGARKVLLSAEDFETMLVRPRIASQLVQEMQRKFQADVIMAVYLRKPSDQFWSLVSQVSDHAYFDVFQLLGEVLRTGYIRMANPVHGEFFAPEWMFFLDHGEFIARFRKQVPGVHLALFDFDNGSYPGEEMFSALGLDPAALVSSRDEIINSRRSADIVRKAFVHHVSSLLPPGGDSAVIERELEKRVTLSPEIEDAITAVIDQKFAAGSRSMLEEEYLPSGDAPGK